MRALVTGAAGFVGSTLVDRLLELGHHVVGVDAFTPYYGEQRKRDNLAEASAHPNFGLVEGDLCEIELGRVLDGADVVFHQAAQPGVRLSWSQGFEQYVHDNVVATQRLLEFVKDSSVERVVYASSSSVYGNAAAYPTTEDTLPAPHSPYGVTKLAAEHLCGLYAANYGVPTVSLRYFTVYGPRQRPDMATHRLVSAALTGTSFPLYGDGSHLRDFTFVDDIVDANIAAATADVPPGTVCNAAGGGEVSMADLIALVGELAGREVAIERLPEQPGDVKRTGGTIERAARLLSWSPKTPLEKGLRAQVDWHAAESPTP
ncbi:MAG TPA: NAD-dependent epimerase/dehydratase family protein [Acidimicrobiales bacterium]